MSQSESHIRFGVICSAHSLPAWQMQSLRQAMKIDNVELALVVIESPARTAVASVANPKKASTSSIWNWVQGRLSSRLPLLQPTPLESLLGSNSVIDCNVIKTGEDSSCFKEADIEKIRAANLDFIIRFAAGRVEGDVLESSRFGVWYYHLGADDAQAHPAGFWEIYKGNATSSCSLRRLGAQAQSDRTLKWGRLKTLNASYSANLSQLLIQGSRLLAQACLDIGNGVDPVIQNSSPLVGNPARHEPGSFECVMFYLRLKRNKLKNFYTNLFVHRHWGLALSFSPIEDLWLRPNSADVSLLPLPSRATFHADPFGFCYQDGLAILHERWSSIDAHGAIACSFIDKDSLDELRLKPTSETDPAIPAVETLPVDIKFSHHSSYPYVFEYEGEYYCVPETSEAARVSLYRFGGSSGEWTYITDIISDFAAVDSSIVRYSGKWWLFCTNLKDNPDSHLYIFHADELLGPWKPHLNNPVKMDIRSARPAGTPFEHEGALYRPAQDSSRSYGGAIAIQKVTDLSPISFAEEHCGDLKLLADNLRVDGMHTLSVAGESIVLDYYRRAFLPNILVHRLKLYLQSKRRK